MSNRKGNSSHFNKTQPPEKRFTADPGWNDPPMLNYTPDNPPPKSRITNKRVAFPLSSRPNVTAPTPAGDLERALENFRTLLGEIEVSERLQLLQQLELLKSSVLPESGQKYVMELSDFLCKRDVVKANEILLRLSMEHGVASAPWIGSIQRLVAVMQMKNK